MSESYTTVAGVVPMSSRPPFWYFYGSELRSTGVRFPLAAWCLVVQV